jgi:hypothetical protein
MKRVTALRIKSACFGGVFSFPSWCPSSPPIRLWTHPFARTLVMSTLFIIMIFQKIATVLWLYFENSFNTQLFKIIDCHLFALLSVESEE